MDTFPILKKSVLPASMDYDGEQMRKCDTFNIVARKEEEGK